MEEEPPVINTLPTTMFEETEPFFSSKETQIQTMVDSKTECLNQWVMETSFGEIQ